MEGMKIMNKRKITTALCFSFLLFLSLLAIPNNPLIRFVWSADAYGNQINWASIEQYNVTLGGYELVVNMTSSGQTVRVHDSWVVRFKVGMRFNSTLASSTSQAITYTRIYMNLTNGGSIWTNKELNNTSCVLSGSWYYLVENGVWNQTGKPTSGVTYLCSIRYEGYY